MMNSQTIINKYGIDVSELNPAEILAALHKRVVDTENLVKKLVIQLNNFGQDIEMINTKYAEILEKISK